jgi:Putative DNA-binding domain
MPADSAKAKPGNWAPSYAAVFAPGLIDPDYQVPAGVVGPGGKGAIRRYNVYRNNVTVSLIDALAAVFPATQRITGVEFFRAMARFHVRAAPPQSPLLFEYGRTFPDFIVNYEYAQGMPYLADTARIERAWLDAYHAADMPPLPAHMLVKVPQDLLPDVTFVPHPAARIVQSAFPALSIFVANRGDGPVRRIESATAEDTLITRPENEVMVRRLPPGGATFLLKLLSGKALGEAAALAIEASSDFDLSANLAGMIEAGVFTALSVGDQA